MHDGQAGVAEGEQLAGGNAQQLPEDRAQLGQAVRAAVVAQVGARQVPVVGLARQPEEGVGKVELLRRRLAPGQVQLQPGGEEGLVLLS